MWPFLQYRLDLFQVNNNIWYQKTKLNQKNVSRPISETLDSSVRGIHHSVHNFYKNCINFPFIDRYPLQRKNHNWQIILGTYEIYPLPIKLCRKRRVST